MELQERDIRILNEVSRWRFLLGRHVVGMCDFPSQSTASRRLRVLVEGKYLERKRVLYGFPALYTVAHKGRVLIGANKRADKVNLALIPHNVAVLDFLFRENGATVAVEIELSLKSLDSLRDNIKVNYIEYERQIWVLEKRNTKIERTILNEIEHYPGVEVLYLTDILNG